MTGNATWTDCWVLGHPNITSATVTITGNATVRTALAVVTATTEIVTFDTDETTTMTEIRTFTIVPLTNNVIEAGTGATVDGILNPSTDAEVAHGTIDDDPNGTEINAIIDFISGLVGA